MLAHGINLPHRNMHVLPNLCSHSNLVDEEIGDLRALSYHRTGLGS